MSEEDLLQINKRTFLTEEEFRRFVIDRLDNALARLFIIRGDDRRLLQAMRSYVVTATNEDIKKLMDYLPE